jgi:hypothetical protein
MKKLLRIIGRVPIIEPFLLERRRKRIIQDYQRGMIQVRKKGDRDAEESLKYDYRSELAMLHEDQELRFTNQLLRTARRLRVHTPAYPKIGKNGFIESEDWDQGIQGELYLTVTGIAKVRAAINEEEKRRSERRAPWVQWLTALAGVIGALTGLVAVLLN